MRSGPASLHGWATSQHQTGFMPVIGASIGTGAGARGHTIVAVAARIVTGASFVTGASIGTGASVQTTMAVVVISNVAVLAGGRPAGRRDLGSLMMLRAMRAGAAGRGGRPRGRRPADQLRRPGHVATGRGRAAGQLHHLCNETAVRGQLRHPGNMGAGRAEAATTVMTVLVPAAARASVP